MNDDQVRLDAGTADQRRLAVESIVATDRVEAMPQLVTLAVSDRSVRVRDAARAALDQLAHRHHLDLVVEALNESIPLRPLVEALGARHAETRAWAAQLLAPERIAQRFSEGKVPVSCLHALARGRAATTRPGWWAALVLLELGDTTAITPLSHALRVGSRRVRSWLLPAFGEIGYLRIVRLLCEVVEDRKAAAQLRCHAADALGWLGHPAALPALRGRARLLSFDDGDVKAACRQAIRNIEERGVAGLPMATGASTNTENLPRPASPPPPTATLPRSAEPA